GWIRIARLHRGDFEVLGGRSRLGSLREHCSSAGGEHQCHGREHARSHRICPFKNAFYGGNPIDSLTAAYSGWTLPSEARMIRAGSTQVRPRIRSGRSPARTIANSVISGGSPSLNMTGRLRTMFNPAPPAAD